MNNKIQNAINLELDIWKQYIKMDVIVWIFI